VEVLKLGAPASDNVAKQAEAKKKCSTEGRGDGARRSSGPSPALHKGRMTFPYETHRGMSLFEKGMRRWYRISAEGRVGDNHNVWSDFFTSVFQSKAVLRDKRAEKIVLGGPLLGAEKDAFQGGNN